LSRRPRLRFGRSEEIELRPGQSFAGPAAPQKKCRSPSEEQRRDEPWQDRQAMVGLKRHG
jgi:hypothetical protein